MNMIVIFCSKEDNYTHKIIEWLIINIKNKILNKTI